MSDTPERAVHVMRRELEMVLKFDADLVERILAVDENPDLVGIDALDENDTELLRSIGHHQRDLLFGLSQADAQVLLDVSEKINLLGKSEYSDQRHEFLLRRNFIIARECGGLANALEERDSAERIVRWINREQDGSPETNKDYRTAFRMLGELATDGDEKPDSIEWVPGGYPRNYDPAPDPAKMYRWEEHVVPMIESCHNSRDRALIALAFDAGARPGELFDLTIDRFADHKYGMQVTFERGKQGTRSPVLVPSVQYVQEWLEDHPGERGSDDPVWCKRNRPESVTNNRIRDVFKERADAADMTQPSKATPTRFRKSSASHLASQSVSQAHLEDHHGWRRGSKTASRYIAVFGDANDREIARAHGVTIEAADEPDPIGPVPCPRCGQKTPREGDFCMHCNQATDPEAVRLLQQVKSMIQDELVDAEDRERREKLVSADRTIDKKPHMMSKDDLHEFLASSSASD